MIPIDWKCNPNEFNVIYGIEFYGYSKDIFSDGNDLVARYIGQTTRTVKERINEHIKKKHCAVNEYLRYNPIKKIVVYSIKAEASELNYLEKQYINAYKDNKEIPLINRKLY